MAAGVDGGASSTKKQRIPGNQVVPSQLIWVARPMLAVLLIMVLLNALMLSSIQDSEESSKSLVISDLNHQQQVKAIHNRRNSVDKNREGIEKKTKKVKIPQNEHTQEHDPHEHAADDQPPDMISAEQQIQEVADGPKDDKKGATVSVANDQHKIGAESKPKQSANQKQAVIEVPDEGQKSIPDDQHKQEVVEAPHDNKKENKIPDDVPVNHTQSKPEHAESQQHVVVEVPDKGTQSVPSDQQKQDEEVEVPHDDKKSATSLEDQIERKPEVSSTVNQEQQPGGDATTHHHVEFDRDAFESVLSFAGPALYRKSIFAFLEPPLDDMISYNQGDPNNQTDKGQIPIWKIPLPLRKHKPDDLRKIEYPKFRTCEDMPGKLPIDRGLILVNGATQIWNTIRDPPATYDDTPHCPVDADPFLPWIHDIIPSGNKIRFIAQNKRKCNTGVSFLGTIQKMSPQNALFQPVSVQRIPDAKERAPGLYSDSSNETRYRLVDYSEADDDGQQTRFICRFHATMATGEQTMIGETLSEFPFNYEFVGWRRLHPTMISPKGSDKSNMYSSTLLFDCPVPKEYQSLVASGETVLSDGTPTLRVDLIPIRTSPRYGLDEVYLTEDMAGPKNMWQYGNITSKRGLWREKNATVIGFDPKKRFGDNHVLPLVEASGRWANLPICIPPSAKELQHDREAKPVEEGTPKSAVEESNRPFELVACTWASASYATRGKGQPATNSSLLRLSEWLEFHLMVGFDHIFVYDNSAANTPTDTLRPVLDRFPADKVTRVDWPQVVCNNNEPNAPNPGERSSQYAAENSCRVRYGDMTKWMASFDVDEYMVPMGNFTNLKDMLRKIPDNIHIVDLRSSRTKLRIDASVPVKKGDNRFMQKDPKKSYLESYNCDTVPLPKPYTGDRARKEIYRTDFVLYHFVHYSLVTQNTLVQYKDASPNQKWQREAENETINNPEYVTDEINEAILVHAKGGKEGMLPWKQRCKVEKNRNQCNFGFPWPSRMDYATLDGVARNGNGYFYNCHSNSRIKDFWVPRLEKAISERRR